MSSLGEIGKFSAFVAIYKLQMGGKMACTYLRNNSCMKRCEKQGFHSLSKLSNKTYRPNLMMSVQHRWCMQTLTAHRVSALLGTSCFILVTSGSRTPRICCNSLVVQAKHYSSFQLTHVT